MEEKTIENLPLIEKDVFLKELRSVTSPAHKKLEEARLSKVIVSEDLTVEEYASYLGKMALVMSSFEKDIFPLLKPYFSDLCHRNKLALLEKDLNFLSQKITLKQFDFPGFSKITAISLTFKIAKASPSTFRAAYNLMVF